MSICNQAVLSDHAFLEHMISHHQVAVNMAKQLQSKSMNTVILEYLRDLIRQQQYEITQMGSVFRRGVPQQFSTQEAEKLYDPSKYQFYGIVGSGSGMMCDANMFMPTHTGYHTVGCKIFLHPNATAKDSLSHTSLLRKESYDNLSLGGTQQVSAMEREFLEHMITHHQVAVDISRVMSKKTDNQHIMALCYDIIRSQEHEISKMRDLLSWERGWRFPSNCF
jgi:uncharacterized protein (DUF305 family)